MQSYNLPSFYIWNIRKMSDFICDHFLRDIIQTPNRGKRISSLLAQYTYRNGYLLNIISTCGFKIYRKFSYSDDHVRVVIFLIRVSRVFFICRLLKKNSGILHPYRRRSIRKDILHRYRRKSIQKDILHPYRRKSTRKDILHPYR